MIRKLLVSESLCRQNISRHLPQYGAVFMASNLTRKECFERELFGLPYEYADFVMGVKTGMLLFLFDFQEKNLYGVFEASTDGGMNIVPDAYKSTSNRKFPAQVPPSYLPVLFKITLSHPTCFLLYDLMQIIKYIFLTHA